MLSKEARIIGATVVKQRKQEDNEGYDSNCKYEGGYPVEGSGEWSEVDESNVDHNANADVKEHFIQDSDDYVVQKRFVAVLDEFYCFSIAQIAELCWFIHVVFQC